METQNNNQMVNNSSGKVWAGLVIAAIGTLLLVDNIGFNMPSWIFHWSNILIVIGLFIGIKHNFKNGNGLVLIMIGAFFTLREAFDGFFDFDRVGWPLLIIALGMFLIFKPKSDFSKKAKWKRKEDKWRARFAENDPFVANTGAEPNTNPDAEKKTDSLDYLESVNVFGGSNQIVYSKNFKGGEITAVFGGSDVNLTQADFEGEVVIDVTAVFGGAKIIVPPGWDVKSEVTAIFGGLDDKRSIQPLNDSPKKVLIIKGVAMFGGIDIRNY
jgi:predicted membrane protein